MQSLKATSLNGASTPTMADPSAVVVDRINAACSGLMTSTILQVLTGVIAGHIVSSADGEEDGITELAEITSRNILTFSDFLGKQHRAMQAPKAVVQ